MNSATNYKDFTIDFANNSSITAINLLNTTVNGTYAVSSEIDVLLKLNFYGNASFVLLNNTWKVTSFTASTYFIKKFNEFSCNFSFKTNIVGHLINC